MPSKRRKVAEAIEERTVRCISKHPCCESPWRRTGSSSTPDCDWKMCRLVGYLTALGISDVYASPLFRARENSSHGYDVVDHGTIDPVIGTEDDLQSFARQLRQAGLGLMLDVVPNHMGIDDPHNGWWQDVLENGPSSPYATFFDIDWSPPKESLKDKVLLPFLGDQYGTVLESRELQLAYDGDRFSIVYFDRQFPVGPTSWLTILQCVLEKVKPLLAADHAERMELESIMTALENLPPRTERDSTVHAAAAAGKRGYPSPIGGPLFDLRRSTRPWTR